MKSSTDSKFGQIQKIHFDCHFHAHWKMLCIRKAITFRYVLFFYCRLMFLEIHCNVQCVMSKVKESTDLMTLNTEMRTLFPKRLGHDTGIYWPHLSLVYGDLSEEERLRIVKEIQANPVWSAAIVNAVFDVSEISIWFTGGVPAEWYRFGAINLK
jgi:hypothetical protein